MTAQPPAVPSIGEQLERIGSIPIVRGEMHKTGYFQPLVVRQDRDGVPELAAIVAPSLISYGIVEGGKWRAAYTPTAMHCLPYGLRRYPSGVHRNDLFMLAHHGAEAGPAPESLFAPSGDVVPPLRRLFGALEHVRVEGLALVKALDRLYLTDLLVPLEMESGSALWSIDQARLRALTPSHLAALMRDDFAAADIACAISLSRRRLPRKLRSVEDEGINSVLLQTDFDGAGRSLQLSPFIHATEYWLDESETVG
jgi:SapC